MRIQRPLSPGLPTAPEAIFARLCGQEDAFWLDSGAATGHHARYHFLGSDPSSRLSVADGDPLMRLDDWLSGVGFDASGTMPAARVVGFLTYDVGQYIEDVPAPAGPVATDAAWFGCYDACITVDMATGRTVVTAASEVAAAALETRLQGPARPAFSGPLTQTTPTCATTLGSYAEQVERVRDYIAAGDVYQVNISHAFSAQLRPGVEAADVYRRLRRQHGAAFGGYLGLSNVAILSNSPECLMRLKLGPDGHLQSWPLKGTRPASGDPVELAADPKERAEHIMIVDLVRNDLGRVSVVGTVAVPRLLEVVRHPTVLHLESRVEAQPRPDASLCDVLRAIFPGGSITGAPKVRAMEIIAEIEQAPRGIYCGALGYLDWDGATSVWNIPIRTATISGQTLSFRSGGGVVADSVPAREYEETLVKARAFLDVLTV